VAAAETVQPAKFIQELSSALEAVRVEPPRQQALSKAKAGLLNSFVFNFASTYSQLQRTLVYQLLGLPPVSMVNKQFFALQLFPNCLFCKQS
jgi:predicted Zn-dependent peptidase